jgi:hypothetical protein
VFATGDIAPESALQETFYPKLLKLLFWRSKMGEKNSYDPVGDFSKWHKLIPFEDIDVLKTLYSDSGLDSHEDLLKKHLQYMPNLI